jgi:hypothetical protein
MIANTIPTIEAILNALKRTSILVAILNIFYSKKILIIFFK